MTFALTLVCIAIAFGLAAVLRRYEERIVHSDFDDLDRDRVGL